MKPVDTESIYGLTRLITALQKGTEEEINKKRLHKEIERAYKEVKKGDNEWVYKAII